MDGDNRDGDGGGEEGEEQQTVIVVAVGRLGDDLALKFSPEEVVAKPGDLVQFQFYPAVCSYCWMGLGLDMEGWC